MPERSNVFLWHILDRTAAALDSMRGEGGLVVCMAVVVAALAAERLLFGANPAAAFRNLGFRRPNMGAILATFILCLTLLTYHPAFLLATGGKAEVVAGWPLLLAGMFLQGGIAEEVVFRGYLFRRLRRGRTFWRAALLSALPFIAVHLLLFRTLDPVVAFVALMASVSLSFPLALLFERSGGSIWLPALLHFIVQGTIKVVIVPETWSMPFSIGWTLWASLVPWALFLVLPRNDVTSNPRPGPVNTNSTLQRR
jgi:membrane protease YdiL (CAAX protease family)